MCKTAGRSKKHTPIIHDKETTLEDDYPNRTAKRTAVEVITRLKNVI